MVQQIITLCDVCYDGGKTSPAEGHVVTVAGGTWHLELCEAHRAALIYPLADVAERLGQAVKPEPKGKGDAPSSSSPSNGRPVTEPCLFCGAQFARTGVLSDHLRRHHDVEGLAGAYGLTCPVCGRESKTATSLGRHCTMHVDGGGVPEAFRYAAEHGDPHDVVAKRLAELGLTALPPRVKP